MLKKIIVTSLAVAAVSVISTSAHAFGVSLDAGIGAGALVGGATGASAQIPLTVTREVVLQQATAVEVKQDVNTSVRTGGHRKQAAEDLYFRGNASVQAGAATDGDAELAARRTTQAAAKVPRATSSAVRSAATKASNASVSGSIEAHAGVHGNSQ